MDGYEHRPNVNDLVQLVHDKFTRHMQNDVDEWEENEVRKEQWEMERVKGLLLDHHDNCKRIYIITILLCSVTFSLMSCASLGWLLGGLTLFLFLVLVAQIITIRMRQRKALFYAELVNRIVQNPGLSMWPVIFRVARTYAPYITLPFACLVGVVGYNIEGLLSDKFTPYQKSISQQRKERQEAEANDDSSGSSLKERKFVPTSVFEKNLSPSLQNQPT